MVPDMGYTFHPPLNLALNCSYKYAGPTYFVSTGYAPVQNNATTGAIRYKWGPIDSRIRSIEIKWQLNAPAAPGCRLIITWKGWNPFNFQVGYVDVVGSGSGFWFPPPYGNYVSSWIWQYTTTPIQPEQDSQFICQPYY